MLSNGVLADAGEKRLHISFLESLWRYSQVHHRLAAELSLKSGVDFFHHYPCVVFIRLLLRLLDFVFPYSNLLISFQFCAELHPSRFRTQVRLKIDAGSKLCLTSLRRREDLEAAAYLTDGKNADAYSSDQRTPEDLGGLPPVPFGAAP